jgi:DNA-binding MarR family transcriptional regulator
MPALVDIVNKSASALGEGIAEEIHALRHLFSALQYRALRGGPHELAHMEGRILGFVDKHPGASHTDLIAHLARDKGQITKLIKGLRDRNLLQAKVDTNDRRIQRLFLTSSGRAMRTVVQRERTTVIRRAMHDFDLDDRRALLKFLRKVRQNLEE